MGAVVVAGTAAVVLLIVVVGGSSGGVVFAGDFRAGGAVRTLKLPDWSVGGP